MPSLQPQCRRCDTLNSKITQLEARITNLHSIREDEILIDSFIAAYQTVDATGINSSAPCLHPVASVECTAEGPWTGDRPKIPECSTPIISMPWSDVPNGRGRGRRASRHPRMEELSLSNRFQVLSEPECTIHWPPLPAPGMPRKSTVPASKPGGSAASSGVHRSLAAPSVAATSWGKDWRQSGDRSRPPLRQTAREKPHRMPSSTSPPTATLVVGSSMVRNLDLHAAKTFCFPGALVADINASIEQVAREHCTASTIAVHVGSNDIKIQQSEKLKDYFKELIETVFKTGMQCVISGPIPSPCFGDMNFSRIRQLHIWLKTYCSTLNIPFADNFNSFWNRRYLFGRDARHLNRQGTELLAHNIKLALNQGALDI